MDLLPDVEPCWEQVAEGGHARRQEGVPVDRLAEPLQVLPCSQAGVAPALLGLGPHGVVVRQEQLIARRLELPDPRTDRALELAGRGDRDPPGLAASFPYLDGTALAADGIDPAGDRTQRVRDVALEQSPAQLAEYLVAGVVFGDACLREQGRGVEDVQAVLADDEPRAVHPREQLLRGQELLEQPDALVWRQGIQARIDLVEDVHLLSSKRKTASQRTRSVSIETRKGISRTGR